MTKWDDILILDLYKVIGLPMQPELTETPAHPPKVRPADAKTFSLLWIIFPQIPKALNPAPEDVKTNSID
jgi:hypothetical protein